MVEPGTPSLALAPMDGVTDAPLRQLVGEWGVFDYAVSEFVRVSVDVLPAKVFPREVPELLNEGRTVSGLPVHVQILGGDPDRMAKTAANAVKAGARVIDINFGCPAPTVNRNDGGATLLQFPCRIRDVVRAVRDAVSPSIPVSAKVRLGWESIDDVFENARMVQEGGASWITIHARTRLQRYQPPVFWKQIDQARRQLAIPVVANGDIFTLDDFKRCRNETGCQHFMIGRGALAHPSLAGEIRSELGLKARSYETSWKPLFTRLLEITDGIDGNLSSRRAHRIKQWLNIAKNHGDFPLFDEVKRLESAEELLARL